MTEAAANKWVHQSDDLFIRFINNIHYEGTSLIEMPATIITVLKNTKKNVPDVILDLISVVGLYSTADCKKLTERRLDCCSCDFALFRGPSTEDTGTLLYLC